LVDSWPVGAAAAAVLGADTGGRTVLLDRVGDEERVFDWASLTKLLVALAVLVAVEEETLALDAPAGPPGSTVRHLLAHASGLGPDGPTPLSAPGRRRIYSSVGYEILADTLAQAAGLPFAGYLSGGVLTPLSMSGTELPPGASPASGARGTLADLLALAVEALVPRLVSRPTQDLATRVAFPGLAGVLPGYGHFDPCDWGLGFEVKGAKAPHWTGTRTAPATFGHFGRAGGFLWVDPTRRLACAALGDRDFGPWAVDAWTRLADAVVEEWAPTVVG
ncbi:MAG TPA: serine hydrolase domain-containing protein, partial [Acidimicrobiales bacterium]|nr:serine hydrolase domain-containing protein [Acidimicrobiales bacterium]